MGRPEYINDDDTVINLSEFKQSSNQRMFKCSIKFINSFSAKRVYKIHFNPFPLFSAGTAPLCYLGLEHVNKTQRRSRFNYLEKAIKIYN